MFKSIVFTVALALMACASRETRPDDDALLLAAEKAWRERLAVGVVGDDPNLMMAQDGFERLRDPIAPMREQRLAAAPCRLTIDHSSQVLRLGETPVFFPSADFNAALAEGLLPPTLVRQLPTRDGLLVGLDVDDERSTLWHVSCAPPHRVRRVMTLAKADFSRAVIDLSGEALVVPREVLFHVPLGGDRPRPLRLTGPPCGHPEEKLAPELWTADGIVGRCADGSLRVVAATPAGWRTHPFVEVSALVRDKDVIWLGLRRDALGKVWRSKDDGRTWEAIDLYEGLDGPTPSAEEIAVSGQFVAVRTSWLDDTSASGEVFVSSNRQTFARARRPALVGNPDAPGEPSADVTVVPPAPPTAQGGLQDVPIDRLVATPGGLLIAGTQVLDNPLAPLTWVLHSSRDLGRTWRPYDDTTLPERTPPALTLPDGTRLEPGPRGLWRVPAHGSRTLVLPR